MCGCAAFSSTIEKQGWFATARFSTPRAGTAGSIDRLKKENYTSPSPLGTSQSSCEPMIDPDSIAKLLPSRSMLRSVRGLYVSIHRSLKGASLQLAGRLLMMMTLRVSIRVAPETYRAVPRGGEPGAGRTSRGGERPRELAL